MITKLIFVVLLIVTLFVLFLLLSYYGFQVSPDLDIQQVFVGDVNSVCKKMDGILSTNDISYSKIIRSISHQTDLQSLGLNSAEVETVEQCLHGSLPTLRSNLIYKKIGFFEGIGEFESKGKSVVVLIENAHYLRLENFEIGYNLKNNGKFQVPEFHVYLSSGDLHSPEIYLDKLKTKLGNKNYVLPDVDLNTYNTVVIYDEIHKIPYAKVVLHDPIYIRDVVFELIDDNKTVPSPKIESRILNEKHGFFEGVKNFNAKGSVTVDYLEYEGTLQIDNFEISKGEDLRLYLTKGGDVKKSGYWVFDDSGRLYVSSANTDEVLRYSPDGSFDRVFVTAGSGGLNGPRDLTFDDSGRLYVSSANTDEVLRYSPDGSFDRVFVTAGRGGLNEPKGLTFGPDENLYVNNGDGILRFNGQTGSFQDEFVISGEGGLELSAGLVFDDSGRLYVSSANTDEVLRYSPDGSFDRVFVTAGSGGLNGPKDLLFSSDKTHLLVTSFLTDEVLRYDATNGSFVDNFISSQNGDLVNPNYVSFGPDENLYVNNGDGILRFNGQTGSFQDEFVISGEGGLELSAGLVFDDSGRLYVSSANTDEVLRYSPDGSFDRVFVTAGSGGLNGPRDLTFDDSGRLYVSSANTDEVLRYSPDGSFDSVIVDSEFVKMPNGLTFGPDKNLYVVSSDSDDVLSFDSNTGEVIGVFATGGGLYRPFDLTFDDSGRLYVSSANTDEVLRYSPDGSFDSVIVDSEFVKMPNGLTFGPDKNLYVVNSHVDEVLQVNITNDSIVSVDQFVGDRTPDLHQPNILGINDGSICVGNYLTDDIHCYDDETGKYEGLLINSFNRGLVSKENSVIGPDGRLYVSNNLSGEVMRYDSITGGFIDVAIRTETDRLSAPSDLAFGPDDNLYVSSDDKIFKFDGKTGNFINLFITKNSAGLSSPQGLLFDDKFLYVSSYDNNRVLRYDATSGKFETEFIQSSIDLLGPVGTAFDDKGNFYVSNSYEKQIMQYDFETGALKKNIDVDSFPHDLVLTDDGILFISFFTTDQVGMYDTKTETFSILFSNHNGISGPTGLVYDENTSSLYISSSKNNKIFIYDLDDKSLNTLNPLFGDGALQYPQGLVIRDDILYVANSANNEVLTYSFVTKSLDVFVYDFSEQLRPGGIAFGLDSVLYMINEIDNNIYRYDVSDGELIDIFRNFNPDEFGDAYTHIPLRDIVFDQNKEVLFASSPGNNLLFAYDVQTAQLKPNYFTYGDYSLNYPTKMLLTPDGQYLLVVNYGENTIVRFKISGEFNDVFVTPGDQGIDTIKKILFGPDGNLYVVGKESDNLLKFDGSTGVFLGKFDLGSNYLGILNENFLTSKYLLNDANIASNDVLVVYDHFLETSFATIELNDTIDIFTPLVQTGNSFVSAFNFVSEPKFQSQEFVKNTGFFVGLNEKDVFGQAKSQSIDHSTLITIENFFIKYDKNEYVSTDLGNILTNGPDLVACIVPHDFSPTCDNSSIWLGNMKINAGDNNFLIHNFDHDKYDQIVIYDNISESSFAKIHLRDYGILRVSGESFVDWLQHYFPIFPLVSIVVMIFPVFFDYIRTTLKVIFFVVHLIHTKSRKEFQIGLQYNPKITILIPAHNEEYGIKQSIETALATDYPNKEIIVINDGSNDRTFEIANSFAERGLIKLIHRETASGSKAIALNYGKNYATGDYVLCMDGDTLLDKNALKNAAKYLSDKDVIALSGNVRILSGDDGVNNLLTKLQTYEYLIAIELGRRFTSFFQILLVISGAFGIFKKSSFMDVHTFDKDTLTEDFDLTMKLRKTKGKILFVGDSIANTYCPNNWKGWASQRNRWAYGQLQTLSKNKNILTSKFPLRDKISFFDMFLLDVILSLFFPIGLAVFGLITFIMIIYDNLHILVYSLTFVMLLFMLSELVIFLLAVAYSGKTIVAKLVYLVPIMTFIYRPYLKLVNLRAFLRAYFGKKSSWS